jgi:hypothetical protein
MSIIRETNEEGLQRQVIAARKDREEWALREAGYVREIQRLVSDLEATARAGVKNAADLAAERQAGAARVERIRAALTGGSAPEARRWAMGEALENVDCPPNSGTLYKMSRAFLALAEDLRATRESLATIETGLRGLVAEHFGAKP